MFRYHFMIRKFFGSGICSISNFRCCLPRQNLRGRSPFVCITFGGNYIHSIFKLLKPVKGYFYLMDILFIQDATHLASVLKSQKEE